MARGLNKVMIIGYLGRDPEMRFTPSGKSVANFSVACTRSWLNADGEEHSETEWFNVVAWGDLAEISRKYLSIGSLVYIEGRLQTRTWKDNEGNQHKSIEITARDIMLLNGDDIKENQKESNESEDTEHQAF
jgi:single-strand DNA-binding protein